MSYFMNLARAAAAATFFAVPGAVSAQARVSIGAGGGMAGSTDASLSDGKAGAIVMPSNAAACQLAGSIIQCL